MTPDIAVIIPTYNRKSLLARLLDSLNHQTLPRKNFDIFVADDGSTDGTPQFLERGGIPFGALPRRGPAAARNLGAQKTKAPVLVFIDDDALATPGWLSAVHKNWKAGALSNGAEGDVRSVGVEGPLTHTVHHLGPGGNLTCNLAVTRDAFEKINGFNEHFPFPMNEDFEFFLRLKKQGEVHYLKDMVVEHPVRNLKPWTTLAGAPGFARQRVISDNLLFRLWPEDYKKFKLAPTARSTVKRLAVRYFWANAFKNPTEMLLHPIRSLCWMGVCFLRQLFFALYLIFPLKA